MKATINWQGEVAFEATSATGHKIMMDGPEASGGQNKGPRPMEMLLMGLGGCTSYDVVSILKKSRQEVVDVQAQLEATRVDAIPAVFETIHIHFVVSGKSLKEAQVEKAVKLSAEKYCSASLMLEKGGVKITHSFEVVEA